MRIDIDNEIVVAFLFGGVRKDVARIGLDGNFWQFLYARCFFSVFAAIAVVFLAIVRIRRHSLEHRFPPLKRSIGRSGRVQALAVSRNLAEAKGFGIA
jgi:hypothetical protein